MRFVGQRVRSLCGRVVGVLASRFCFGVPYTGLDGSHRWQGGICPICQVKHQAGENALWVWNLNNLIFSLLLL